jgi:hypothetical protein
MKYNSSCSCGALTLKSDAEPVRVSICHCHACQKRTGSVFGVQARWNRSEVKFAGKTSQWVREVEGEKITYQFCPTCGSTVYWFIESYPEIVASGVGNFADSKFPKPTVTVFAHRKHSWVVLPEGIEQHDQINQ